MKRAFDVGISLCALVVLAPLLVVIAVAVAVTSRGGAFFRQTRVGVAGKPFQLLKFRSMRPGSEAHGQLTLGGHDPRITAVGRLLRRTKLDELPQLWNVLVGDMSLVGPRPEVPRYVERYTAEQRRVLRVRPGITGPASLAYIDEAGILAASTDPERTYVEEVMPAKLRLDLAYVDDHSLGTDLRILVRTVCRLLLRS